MKIVSYVRGRCIGPEDPYAAFMTYIAMNAIAEGREFNERDAADIYNYSMGYFDEWFNNMVENHEINIVDENFDRILNQYLVTAGSNGI